MHPNVLHLFGVSPRNSPLPFLAFHDDYTGTAESRIGLALKKNLEEGLFLGLQTVAGLSSGLSYLSIQNYPFASVGLAHFSLLLTRAGKLVICFDPEVLGDISELHQHRPGSVKVELDIFNRLCQKTFDTASRVHRENDLPEDRFEELHSDHGQDLDGSTDSSLRSSDPSPYGTDPTISNQQTPDTLPAPKISSSQRPPQKLSQEGHRRELVWKSEAREKASLEHIACEFKEFLDISPSLLLVFNRRRGRYVTRTAHRCPGYQRDKVLLTADVKRSAIVSYLTPTPHEICPVCKEIVRDAEIFDCICGGDDDESTPTIRCLSCSIWCHRPCVGFIDSARQSFVCGNCKRTSKIYQSHLLRKGRGLPLWMPQPSMNDPIPYRIKGVSIGDVGILNPYGGFDFLFNICLPHDDPINPSVLPDGFVPIYPPLTPKDVHKFREFASGSFLATSTRYLDDKPALDMRFECSNPEEAILVMPDGAYHEELFNLSTFKHYMVKHLENWYKFVNGRLRREAKNGDIHLVVGCDKTTNWGMAAFSNPPGKTSHLTFMSGDRQRGMSSGSKHVWQHSALAGRTRVGPGDGEGDALGATPEQPLPNQCLFVQTMNVLLADDIWCRAKNIYWRKI